ncbi:stress responsive A/B barrel domain protein [Xylaria cf. heliscus]|nr:stress responsive A/B barrel domain protein [Xylaria cf. heliscus]
MTLVHIVLFRFKPDVTKEQGDAFLREVKSLKNLPCVKDGRLIVGGPSLTDPIELSKGHKYACISYHENLAALEEYQTSKEQSRDKLPYKDPLDYESICRFDFEVNPEDEYMCAFSPQQLLAGNISGRAYPIN